MRISIEPTKIKTRSLCCRSNGFPGRLVQDAIADVIQVLGKRNKSGSSTSLVDSSGNAPPNIAIGQLPALKGTLLVTYRMVNAVLVFVVSDITANAFLCLRLLDACTKVLVGVCKGVDVTADRLLRKYEAVHSSLGDLIAGGLCNLPVAFVHSSATDEKVLVMPLSASDAARRVRRLLGGGSAKQSSSFVKKGSAQDRNALTLPPSIPETPTAKERKSFQQDPLAEVDFSIPADALPPPPPRAMGALRRPPAPPPEAVVAPPAFEGAVEEEKMEIKEEEEEKIPEEWVADFGGAELVEEEKEEEPEGPVITVADLRQALQLVEIYTAELKGGKLQSAEINGTVCRRLAPFGLHTARFRLLPSSKPVVDACLELAALNKTYSSIEDKDRSCDFQATLSGAPMDCAYLQYSLPSVACPPPLQFDFAVAPPSGDAKEQLSSPNTWQALLLVQLASNPELMGPVLDVVVEVNLPPELCVLVKTSPAAQWSPNQCKLRWVIGKINPGESCMARAIVAAKQQNSKGVEQAVMQGAVAKVYFSGTPGSRALSETGFEVGFDLAGDNQVKKDNEGDKGPVYHAGRAKWFGCIEARP